VQDQWFKCSWRNVQKTSKRFRRNTPKCEAIHFTGFSQHPEPRSLRRFSQHGLRPARHSGDAPGLPPDPLDVLQNIEISKI
jgi:hypothetical protein